MERIICSAIQLENGKIYYGHRHDKCIASMNDELSWTMNRQELSKVRYIQGFVSNLRPFLTREEALEVAIKANQLKEGEHVHKQLYSENLY